MLDHLMSLQPAASDPAPNGERRLIWGKNSRDDKKTHAGTTPELGGDAAVENPEAQQKPNAQKKRDEIEELTAERRKRILMHVPSTLLSKYTLGAFYLTDTLLSLLPERELRTVAEEVTGTAGTSGADLMKLENIETILASIFRKGESDVHIAKQLENMIRQKLSQYEELRTKAEQLIAKKQDIPVDRIDQLEQELVLQGVTIDSWLRTASTEEVCDALHIPHMPASQHGVLLTRIRTYLETRRLLENWNMPAIDRNAQLRKMLAEGRSISGIQQELYEETREVLPVLAEIIREQMREEAARTRRWLDGERKKYERDVPNVTLQNHEEVEDATDALFLQRHGVSAHALAREIEQSEAAIALAEGTGNDATVEKIVDAATLCERLHDMREFPGSGQGRAIVTGPANEQRAAEAWAEEMRGELDTLLREQYPTESERKPVEQVFGVEDLFGELGRIRGDLTPSEANPRGVNGYYYPARRRQNLLVLVRSLREHRIVKAVQAQRELATQAPKASEDLTVMDMVEQTRQKLDTAVGDLVALPALNRGIAETIGVPRHVRQRQLTLDNTLRTVTQPGKQARATVADVQVEVEKLSTAARMLKNLETQQAVLLSSEEFTARTGADMYAAYDYATAEILVNEERCRREGRDIAREIEHEKEHAVQDILTRRSGVFPFLHRAAYEVLSEENEQFTGQLIEQAKAWGIAGQLEQIRKSAGSEQEAQAIFQELLTEELLNRYVDWKQGRLQEPTAQEQQLFSAIERARLLEHMQGRELVARNERTRADIQPIRLFQSGTATEEEARTEAVEDATGGFSANVPAEAGETQEAEGKNTMDTRKKLDECQKLIQRIHEFAVAYPAYQGDLKEELPLYQESYDTLLKVFETQMLDGKPYPHPEENPNFKKQVADLSSDLGDIDNQIQGISNKMHDLSEEQPTGLTGYRAFFKGIHFLSPLDIYLMFQDAMEDVKRMWQRRSKQSRAAVAQGLFGWIPENEIAGLRYLGRLAKENEKREQEAEDEEVNVWKEGLKNKDSYQLMEIMSGISHNKDQVKAIMYLLAEKGRINWGDERIWHVLSKHSSFNMPPEECRRDIILRNNWLNKIIQDIWDDKDLFLDWRTTNDNNFTSNRDKFNDFVDTLSQNSGAMSAELERILRIYSRCKKSGETPPQDVNPHLYEKIIEFAMMKGKMNMEQKFFFLIKGIAEGLLPLERLNIINNQVLGTFPFIDYFAGQNNSLPEVKALAAKLTEPGNEFRPGMKTTLFLELEVARDESTRSRVIKLIGSGGDKIDHEDAPMLMAFLDYGGVEQMLQPMGGQKQRMTQEAVKNSYVGFNTLFKAYARAAELESDGIARFTRNDALHLGRSLMAFIHFDNIVLQAANDGKNRQSVTWEQIENETMPSGNKRTPSEFRNPMGALTEDIFKTYGITEVEVGKDKDGNPITVSIKDYLGSLREKKTITNKEEKQRLFDATLLFQRKLLGAIEGNPETFKTVLRRHTEGRNALIQEGEEMTKESVRHAMERRAA